MMEKQELKKQLLLYGDAYSLLREALKEFPLEMWKFKPSAPEWSIHEIIVHLADSEANSYIRCRYLIAEPGKTILAYNQDLWAVKLDYHSQSTDKALELFRLLREASYLLIKDLPGEVWSNTINHPENGLMSMYEWLVVYANHIPGHIGQMQRVYQRWKKS